MNKQSGFSHIELLISLVVIFVISGVGFYVYNASQNRNSRAELANTEPTEVDTDPTVVALTETQKAESATTFTKVIDDPSVGQAFACKINANFWDGVKYYFTSSGSDARKMWVTWDSHIPGGGLGASGRSPKLEKENKVKRYKPDGSTPSNFISTWRFSLKNSSNKRVDSPWMSKQELKKCP